MIRFVDVFRDRFGVEAICRTIGATACGFLTARGYRLLAKVPRLPESVIESIVERFATLQKIMRASIDDLDDVKDVGGTRARAIKEGLSRLAETSILDRYS